ncbi:unnamed protein product [Hymenolepis diminuta]|uniref:Uncharacterized protein n=1 Tax=Hymenolepis diminuta TaxID=6216 RepID=A0A564YMW1_HYMDI|nr:unnamed protein product [Hymenolepis diminuta]
MSLCRITPVCLTCLNASIDFPLFSITASLHVKGTSALMLGRGLTQVTHIKLLLFYQTTHTGQCGFLHVLFISSLPQHAALPLPLSVSHWGFLEYMIGLLNSWCSASQLLLALTQTATNCLS